MGNNSNAYTWLRYWKIGAHELGKNLPINNIKVGKKSSNCLLCLWGKIEANSMLAC
ncbi:hypothetical protein T4C_5279 [Trichinella pseudospiralis]|uniref:Uncharacterized protein n=1 Tax=Trichinella pseudospiralis TaxID=6337 RepID=A0A0V1JSK1_TRIPS|nr:hypothetical protein T4C_5279 [Trichinella pseudospiralis]